MPQDKSEPTSAPADCLLDESLGSKSAEPSGPPPTPEKLDQYRHWAERWKKAGAALARIQRDELRDVDQRQQIALLCGPADDTVPPRAPTPTSGLIEMQRLFRRLANRD